MENKPLETDAEEMTDETLDESSEQELAGEEDVTPTEDAPDFKSKLEEISGREFKDEDDAVKHYKNLVSFVGKNDKAEEPEKPKPDNDIAEIKETVQRIQFLNDNPEAKSYYDDLVLPMARGKNIPPDEAWKSVKSLVEASEEKDNQKEIGVNSKNRTTPLGNPKLKGLVKNARQGSPDARSALIDELVKSGQL